MDFKNETPTTCLKMFRFYLIFDFPTETIAIAVLFFSIFITPFDRVLKAAGDKLLMNKFIRQNFGGSLTLKNFRS